LKGLLIENHFQQERQGHKDPWLWEKFDNEQVLTSSSAVKGLELALLAASPWPAPASTAC
jgi:hypothetical protein